LLVLGQRVALLRRGEAALRGQAKLVERREAGGLLDAAPDVAGPLQRAGLIPDALIVDSDVTLLGLLL